MNKQFLAKSLLSILAFLFLSSCATKEPVELPSFSARQFDTKMYESKVDNFIIVLDASSSMRHPYKGNPKFTTAKAIAQRLNMTIPELGQTAGLRSFGHASEVSKNHTQLFYGMEKYSTANMNDKFKYLTKPGGWSPLGEALDGVGKDLDGLGGPSAVIIISDGLDMKTTLKNAQALKDKFGSSVCFYPIHVGQAPEGRNLLQAIAKIGNCGFFSNSDEILTSSGMASFVEKALLKKKMVMAPPPAPMVKKAKKDSDNDGVYDDQDQCPNTPAGAKVNSVGCWTLDNVLFDFNKDVIKAQAYNLLDQVVVILEKNPAMSIELQGHTDNVGTKAYNMDLSMRRANAVANYLVDKGILRNRLATTGFGYEKPIALNASEFGRSLNRRVEIRPY